MSTKEVNAERSRNILRQLIQIRSKRTELTWDRKVASNVRLKCFASRLLPVEKRTLSESRGRDIKNLITCFFAGPSLSSEDLVDWSPCLVNKSKSFASSPLIPTLARGKEEVNRVVFKFSVSKQERIWGDSILSSVDQLALDPQTAQYQYLKIFKALTPSEREVVTQALKQLTSLEAVDSAANALANTITGKSFSRQERIQLEMETLSKHFQHRRQLLDQSFTAAEVAQLLGTSRQTSHDRVSSQTLLAIKENGKLCFPSWQFDPAGPDGVIDGLPAVLKVLEISDYAKLNWLTRVNPYLDSQTPIQALKAGQKERVIEEASTVGAGQWS
jgi:hypothetical protein